MPHPGVCFFFVLLFFVVLCSVAQATTSAIYTGQYFVTVQLPMQNDRSDITAYTDPQQATTTSPSPVYPVNQITGAAGGVGSTVGYARTGSGSLQDSDAAGARTDAINDANTDDTYSRLQLLIDIPVIRI